MTDFDVIIIGSGIGGLVSAGILAAKGSKVLMVERHVTSGGYLSSFKRKGFVFDSAVDCISGVTPGGIIFRVLDLLGVCGDINFVKVDPIRASIFPDLEVVIDTDINEYIYRLKSLFPSEAAGITGFFEVLLRAYNLAIRAVNSSISGESDPNALSSELFKLINTSYGDLLDEYIHDSRLKAMLSDRCTFIGLPPSRVSALSMIVMIMSYFILGAFRPSGGYQRLSDVLVEGIRKNGGRALFGNGAKAIVMDDRGKECRGIVCDNGEEYTSRYIISNADFNYTFNTLLGSGYASFAENITKNTGASISFFIVYAGVKGDIGPYSSIGYYPSYNMEDFFSFGKEFEGDSTIGITIASKEDPSRAPCGYNTVVLHEMVEAVGKKHFDKERYVDSMIKKAERIIPDMGNRIVVLDSASPQTFQRYTGNINGAAFGWNQIPGFRSIKKHGIGNLFIAGHWGDMGGGVLAAAYSGAKAAGEILAKEGMVSVI